MSLNTILTAGFVIGAAYFISTGQAKQWLDQLSEMVGAGIPKAAPPPAPGGPAAPGPGLGPGPSTTISGGGYPFAQCAGGPSGRAQWCSKHPCLASGEETAGYLLIKNTSNEGEEVSIKMRGGAHSGSCPNSGCCYIVGVGYDGSPNAQQECPHPSTGSLGSVKAMMNPGSVIGKPFGIMARIYPVGGADKIECWLDMSNSRQFQKFWETTSNKFVGKCNGVSGGCADRGELTFFRLDDVGGYSGAQLTKAYTKPYGGGGGGGPGPPAAGNLGLALANYEVYTGYGYGLEPLLARLPPPSNRTPSWWRAKHGQRFGQQASSWKD